MAGSGVRIDRLSADDLMALDGDRGTVPMQVGAILWFEAGQLQPEALTEHLAARLPAAPRLRQAIRRVRFGQGRPVWVDDPAFRLGAHLQTVRVDSAAEAGSLAVDMVRTPLPAGRPLWAARIIVEPNGSVLALALAVHHVVADGLAALALLAALADDAPATDPGFPLAGPDAVALLADNLRGRLQGLRNVPAGLHQLLMATRLLAAGGRAPATSLNRPTSGEQSVVTLARPLAAVREAGHAHHGSVNDVALAVVAGALATTLAGRGEDLPGVVVSVPFSYRENGATSGNMSAVMPLLLPTSGPVGERVTATAAVTAVAKRRPRAVGNSLLRPAFRLLARTGGFRRFIDNQRLVNTIVTNVRGPAEHIRLAGCAVRAIEPLTLVTGNITAVFVVLSYAGTLSLTTMLDPAAFPDREVLADALAAEWNDLLQDAQPSAKSD